MEKGKEMVKNDNRTMQEIKADIASGCASTSSMCYPMPA